MTFGLTPTGFNAMRLADIKTQLENAFIAQFGNINLDPQSVFGQEIGVLSKSFADLWENLEDVYFSQYPNSASGVSLDNVVQLNGITRLGATQTNVVATCAGTEGAFIPPGAIAKIPSTGDLFYNEFGGNITRQNADIVKVQVGSVTTQPYTVILSNESFVYSFPVITFSNTGAIFVTGNQIVANINGVNIATIFFNTDSNTTLFDLAFQISLLPSVASAVVTNPNIITITPNAGFSVVVGQIVVTGGATQATNVISFLAPANANAITAGLTAIINAGTPPWLAIDNIDGTFSINALQQNVPFSANVGLNLSIIYQASPFVFLSENFGPIACPVGALTSIVTSIAGWQSITNLVAGSTGTFTETDAELRIRRLNSIKLLGNATVEAIRAKLLQRVPGVTSALVYENTSLTQQNIIISFPGQFVSGDAINVNYNSNIAMTPVNFTTNQVTTMGLLVSQIENLPGVASASYGGAGNQVVTIVMNPLELLIINYATTSVSLLTATISGGLPQKSFEAVVEGGSNLDIATQIWLSKPAGIETYGNISQNIIDSMGNTQVIYFSRPVFIYIWVQVALTLYTEETFPVNGTSLVAENINTYGNNLGVGIDVLFQRTLAQIFSVQGIASGAMQIAATLSPFDSPTYGTSDITILQNQISVFDLSRIYVTVA